jgi:CheY-like chemotaxis protein
MHNDGTILVVENNPEDLLLITAAFKRLGWTNYLQVVPNGFAAIQYMKGEGPFQDRQRFGIPWLMLLDLDLPLSSGFEFLDWLRQDPELRHLPVVALTGSVLCEELDRADEAGANYLLSKGCDLRESTTALEQVSAYWRSVCPLPDGSPLSEWLLEADRHPGRRPNLGWVG